LESRTLLSLLQGPDWQTARDLDLIPGPVWKSAQCPLFSESLVWNSAHLMLNSKWMTPAWMRRKRLRSVRGVNSHDDEQCASRPYAIRIWIPARKSPRKPNQDRALAHRRKRGTPRSACTRDAGTAVLGGGVNTMRQLRRELARRHERARVDAFHAVRSKRKVDSDDPRMFDSHVGDSER